MTTTPQPQTPAVAQPRRIDLMSSTWTPKPMVPARAGAQDHTKAPSLRGGQRVGFVPGYISK